MFHGQIEMIFSLSKSQFVTVKEKLGKFTKSGVGHDCVDKALPCINILVVLK